MGAGPVRIPNPGAPIQQTVQVQAPPRRLRLEEAPRNEVPEEVAGAVSNLGKMAEVLTVQQRQQQVLDKQAASEALSSGLESAAIGVRGEQGSQQVGLYNQSAQKVLDDLQTQYKDNKAVSALLATRGQDMINVYRNHVQLGAIEATQQEHKAQLTASNVTAANRVAADYVMKPDGTFADGPNAQSARTVQEHVIDSMWPNNPTMAGAFKQDFENKVEPARAQYIAQQQPEALDKFLKQSKYPFSPEQIQNFQTISRNAIEKPYHDAQAQQDAVKAQTETDLNKLSQDKDPSLYQHAYAAAKAGYITHERFEDLTNTKWQGPKAVSDPAQLAFWQRKIQADPTSVSNADIAGIDKDTISPTDRAQLRATLDDSMKALKQPMGAQYIRSRQAIREALTPSIMIDPEKTKLKLEGAMSDLDAAYKGGELKTPQDIQNLQNSIINANTPKGATPRRAPGVHVTAPGGGPIPPAIAARIAAEARSKNFEASSPGSE